MINFFLLDCLVYSAAALLVCLGLTLIICSAFEPWGEE